MEFLHRGVVFLSSMSFLQALIVDRVVRDVNLRILR